jgi:hypothetical protein
MFRDKLPLLAWLRPVWGSHRALDGFWYLVLLKDKHTLRTTFGSSDFSWEGEYLPPLFREDTEQAGASGEKEDWHDK